MSSEIRVLIQLMFRRGGKPRDFVRSFAIDLGGTQIIDGIRTIATAGNGGTTLTLPFRSAGYVWLRNLDRANSVTVAPSASADPVLSLGPNRCALFRPESSLGTLYLVALTAACRVECLLLPGTLNVFLEEETSVEIDPTFIFEEDGVTPIAME